MYDCALALDCNVYNMTEPCAHILCTSCIRATAVQYSFQSAWMLWEGEIDAMETDSDGVVCTTQCW